MQLGHLPIVHALVKACNGKSSLWPRLLPFALWANRTMHNSVTGFMQAELMYGQKPIMPIEQSVTSWTTLPCYEGMSREELLALRIRQLENREEDIILATRHLREARLKNKKSISKRNFKQATIVRFEPLTSTFGLIYLKQVPYPITL